MTQRASFCVYSGKGVQNLRAFLTELFDQITEEMNTADDTEYDDDYEDNYREDAPDVDVETGDDDDEYFPRHVPTTPRFDRVPRAPVIAPPTVQRDDLERAAWDSHGLTEHTTESSMATNQDHSVNRADTQAFSIIPLRFRGFGHLPVVEASVSPPPSDGASIRSTGTNQSNGVGFFRTQQEVGSSSRSNGALTPDLNFAEIGHGRGTGHAMQVNSNLSSRPVVESTSSFDAPGSSQTIRNPESLSEFRNGHGFGYDHALPDSNSVAFSPPPFILHEEASVLPLLTPSNTEPRDSGRHSPGMLPTASTDQDRRRMMKRGLRNLRTFAIYPSSLDHSPNGHEGFPGGKGNAHGLDSGARRH